MERAPEFPACMFGLRFCSRYVLETPLTFDSEVYFPGNERHGIWSAKQLMTIVEPTFAPGYPGPQQRIRDPTHRAGPERIRQDSDDENFREGSLHQNLATRTSGLS